MPEPIVTDTLERIQCDPASLRASAFFEKKTVIDDQVYTQPWAEVTWPIDSAKTVTYTFEGARYTQSYAQTMAAVSAIARQERDEQAAAAEAAKETAKEQTAEAEAAKASAET